MKTKFDNLNNNEKQILESSAYIGVKFDASILTNIWKIDLIEIIKIIRKFIGPINKKIVEEIKLIIK